MSTQENGPAPLILVGGWAYPPSTLGPLALGLGRHFRVSLLNPDPDELARAAESAGPCVLAGWSLGGILCLQQAVSRPDTVAGLVLISSTARFCEAQGYPCGASTASLRAMAAGTASRAERMLDRFFRDCAAPADPRAVDRLVSEALAPGYGSLETGLGLLRELDLRDMLPEILAPALVIHGSGDRIIPVVAARWLTQHMRSARLVVVPDAGHDLPARAPNTVALAMGAWVESLAPTGQP